MRLHLLGIALGLAGWSWLTGCQTPVSSENQPQNIVWPDPPEEARIAYVKMVRRPADIGIQQSSVRRFFQKIFGTGTVDQLVKPFGLALDDAGNLCLTDTGNNSVVLIDRQKKTWKSWDHAGQLPFVSPVAVAKSNQVFYVADPGRGEVIAFDTSGKLRWTVHLDHPSGLTIAAGKLFVADAHQHQIVIYDLAGKFLFAFGQRGQAEGTFNFPTHLSTDAAGHLFVTDSMNSRVQVFDLAGKFQTVIGAPGDAPGYFSRPKGAAADPHGNVYVLDANFDNLQIFNLQNRYLLTVGAAGHEPGEFWLPNGIAISPQNEIFVTDCYNHRVQVFKYVGQP